MADTGAAMVVASPVVSAKSVSEKTTALVGWLPSMATTSLINVTFADAFI
jgi:hypothetical protein